MVSMDDKKLQQVLIQYQGKDTDQILDSIKEDVDTNLDNWLDELVPPRNVPEGFQFIGAKRWSSVGPARGKKPGGGYILLYEKLVVAIDPGYDYLDVMRDLEVHPGHVDIIIATHLHQDHVHNLPALMDLCHDVNKAEYKSFTRRAHPIVVYGTKAVLDYFSPFLDGDYITTKFISPTKHFVLAPGLHINVVKAHHWELTKPPKIGKKGKGKPVGLVFYDDKGLIPLSITGDTKFKKDLIEYHQDSKAVVAHLGSYKRSENHLTFSGVLELVKGVAPDIVIISEFDASEFHNPDTRLKVTDAINITTKIPSFACDTGFRLDLENHEIISDCKRKRPTHLTTPRNTGQRTKNDKWCIRIVNYCLAC
jgi:L-ascorbate metabolism protein UlaG (beta-lactamase superfamily)